MRRIGILGWLVAWLRYTFWITAIGGAISFLSLRSGYVLVGIIAGVATLAFDVTIIVLRMRDIARIQRAAARTPSRHTT